MNFILFMFFFIYNEKKTRASRTILANLCYKARNLNKSPKSTVCPLGETFWNDSIVSNQNSGILKYFTFLVLQSRSLTIN